MLSRRHSNLLGTVVVALVAGISFALLATSPHEPPPLSFAASSQTPPPVATQAPSSPSASPTPSPSGTVTPSASRQAPLPLAAAGPGVSPTRIIIPAIGVNAAVEPVGLCPTTNPNWDCNGAQAGGLATPLLGAENLTGWWDGGALPGQDGPAVIVGHINSAATGNLVFAHLDEMVAGELIEIEPGNLMFQVTSTEQAGKNDFPTNAVYGPTPGPALRLITCGGAFDSATGHYVDNFIVFAVEVT